MVVVMEEDEEAPEIGFLKHLSIRENEQLITFIRLQLFYLSLSLKVVNNLFFKFNLMFSILTF